MDQKPPRDDDPSDMTDFEKNTASEEREQFEEDPDTSDSNRFTQERESEGPDKQRAFGQGA